MLFIALNGDDVGDSIGQSIANDDHDGLAHVRGNVAQAHKMIDKWVKSHGGKEISASGDEGIYSMPEESIKELEQIKSQYKKLSGHDLTIGTGPTMSEASKALIYGKLNGKNQIVPYDESIEDAIQNSPEESSLEDGSEVNDDEAIEDENIGEDSDNDGEAELPVDEDQEQELPEENDGGSEGTSPMVGDPSPGNEEEEIELPESDEEPEMISENEEDNEDFPSIDGEAGQELGEGENGTGELPDLNSEEVDSDKTVYDDLTESDGDPLQEESSGEESSDPNDMMTDMIHAQMNGDESEGEENGNSEELKQDIAEALTAFRAQKDTLEAMKEQNPELYQAAITMLRSMIEMAKQQGMSPEEDLETADAQGELEEEMPYSGDGEEEGEEESNISPSPDMEGEEEEGENDEESPEGLKKK